MPPPSLPTEPERIVALVDLFNVSSSPKTDIDYEEALLLVGELIRRSVANASSQNRTLEVTCRLYGGFVNVNGDPTEQYSRLLPKLRLLRGIESGVRILPEAARALRCMPDALLHGTYKNGGQKMVDQMMAHDAYELAIQGEHSVLLMISDDEDFVPCILTIASRTTTPVRWLRKRPATRNDHYFPTNSVQILTHKAWT